MSILFDKIIFKGGVDMKRENSELHRKLGLKIAYYRKLQGMTQEELAEACDLSAGYVSQLEGPGSYFCPSLKTLFKIVILLIIIILAYLAYDLYFKNIGLYPGRNLFTIVYKGKEYEIDSPMAGLFNIYNLCAAILTLFALGYDFEYIQSRIPLLKVSGRLEMIDMGQDFYVMVDYAHTSNGITKLLEYVKLLPIKRSIVVS